MVVIMLQDKGTMASVIRMVVISILITWEIGPGANFTIDSTKSFTVITQFIIADGTEHEDLSEIRRLWVQNGKIIQSSNANVGGKKIRYPHR
jgi:hypothetical protein